MISPDEGYSTRPELPLVHGRRRLLAQLAFQLRDPAPQRLRIVGQDLGADLLEDRRVDHYSAAVNRGSCSEPGR